MDYDIVAFDLDATYGNYSCINPTIFQGEVDSGAIIDLYRGREVLFSKTLPAEFQFYITEIDTTIELDSTMSIKNIKYVLADGIKTLLVTMDNINTRSFQLRGDFIFLQYTEHSNISLTVFD